MEPIIDASHVYIRYLLGDFRDIGLKNGRFKKSSENGVWKAAGRWKMFLSHWKKVIF